MVDVSLTPNLGTPIILGSKDVDLWLNVPINPRNDAGCGCMASVAARVLPTEGPFSKGAGSKAVTSYPSRTGARSTQSLTH